MMIGNRQILISLLSLIICAFGCGNTRNAEVLYASTEIGAPDGTKATKEIGSAGGTIFSPDGRLTMTVPPNALTETISFSIQPITNKANGGLGAAYRLEPSGKTFTIPLELSIHYSDLDLTGTVAEALSLAYQDEQGAWRAQKSAKLDKDKKTLTFSTSHFSDWSFLARVRLDPVKATVYTGESQAISLILCEEPGFIDRFLNRPANCSTISLGNNQQWDLVGKGTIASAGQNVIYTAPGRKPTPNIAYVVLGYELEQWTESEISRIKGSFAATIAIVDRGYRAAGQTADVVYSGQVCSLERPFTVTGTSRFSSYPFNFTPSSETEGKVSFNAGVSGITMEGAGSYKIERAETDKPRIAMTMNSAGHTRVGSKSGGGTVYIDLIPLDTAKCN